MSSGNVVRLGEIKSSNVARTPTGILEVDRVLGGGLAPGGVFLLAGEPGIGKSTLVAQIANSIPHHHHGASEEPVLYVSGEESAEQLKARFERLGFTGERLAVLTDTNAEVVSATINNLHPIVTIIDSIQMMTSSETDSAGATTKLRASLAILAAAARDSSTPIILIGHVTKELDIAGPKSLEHLVDVITTFEGDRTSNYRLLRCIKNRFGTTDEVGVFSMSDRGLVEVANPSASFLTTRSTGAGSVVTAILEGSRPLLIEIQALATKSRFPYPERRASGFDLKRLDLVIAVLAKHARLPVTNADIHVNVTSGLKIREPAGDLAAALAIASSLTDRIIPSTLIAFGEVGLGGEIRPVRDAARRIQEAKKLGFTSFLIPADAENPNPTKGIIPVTHISEILKVLKV